MGLSNTTLGLTNGTVFFVIPQLLAAEHVPVSKIAAITAVAMSANFWAVIFSPMLDVRFSRRWHATLLAVLTSVLLFLAIVNLHHRHRSLLRQQLRQQTVMPGIQMLDDHVRHVALARQGRQ